MDAFVVRGGRRLRGRVKINGSKNAALPLMAAALLTDEPITLENVPNLRDIASMANLLETLGCQVHRGDPATGGDPHRMTLQVTDASPCLAHYDIVRTMRASICVLGPLLTKRGRARVSMPGGCNIGDRPVDLHLRGLQALGARISLDEGYIVAEARQLKGAKVFLGGTFGSTVLGTANLMSAAVLAEGTTVIESAACEPEVVDLARLLSAMGARIRGAGSPRITIEGVDRLHGTHHPVIPDRIEAGTFIMAAAITNGDVVIENCPTDALTAALDRLTEVGVELEPVVEPSDADPAAGDADSMCQTVRVASTRRLQPVQVVTQPHPGFPTDLQAQIMALLCLADGNSMITEKIFPDRFLHVAELLRMGARLIRNGPTVLVAGVHHLVGAPVMASDLRASAGLVLAGLAARGTTTVNRVYHLDRGYEMMELALRSLGADIERINVSA
jgi:UDP-N-acetylglucosamine 1-carboxyvinyltransferase